MEDGHRTHHRIDYTKATLLENEAGDDPARVAASWEAMEREAHDPPPGAAPRPPFADPR